MVEIVMSQYSGHFLTPTFYVSNFSELDLPILDQLVRDTVFSKVYGETTDSSILK